MTKKLLAILMAAMMLVGVFGVGASAETATGAETLEEAIVMQMYTFILRSVGTVITGAAEGAHVQQDGITAEEYIDAFEQYYEQFWANFPSGHVYFADLVGTGIMEQFLENVLSLNERFFIPQFNIQLQADTVAGIFLMALYHAGDGEHVEMAIQFSTALEEEIQAFGYELFELFDELDPEDLMLMLWTGMLCIIVNTINEIRAYMLENGIAEPVYAPFTLAACACTGEQPPPVEPHPPVEPTPEPPTETFFTLPNVLGALGALALTLVSAFAIFSFVRILFGL